MTSIETPSSVVSCLLSASGQHQIRRPLSAPDVSTRAQRATDQGPRTVLVCLECCRERQEGDVPRALDGYCQEALVGRARSRQPSRQNLAALRDELPNHLHILVVDHVKFLVAELANPSAAEILLSRSGLCPGGPG